MMHPSTSAVGVLEVMRRCISVLGVSRWSPASSQRQQYKASCTYSSWLKCTSDHQLRVFAPAHISHPAALTFSAFTEREHAMPLGSFWLSVSSSIKLSCISLQHIICKMNILFLYLTWSRHYSCFHLSWIGYLFLFFRNVTKASITFISWIDWVLISVDSALKPRHWKNIFYESIWAVCFESDEEREHSVLSHSHLSTLK